MLATAVTFLLMIVCGTPESPASALPDQHEGPMAGPLSYVERSNGLSAVKLEGGPTEIEIGDVNRDGHPDIISIGDHGNPWVNTQEHGVMVWFGDGAGNWSLFQNGEFGYGGIAIGDVNNDGLVDIGYGMHHNYSGVDFGDQLSEVALGDGTGKNWTPWDDGLATNGEDWGMFGTDFADVDNDGDLDLGSVSFGCCNAIHVYRNNGDGTWTQSFGFLGGNGSNEFTFAEFNGDGHADLAGAHANGTVYLGDGQGGFALSDGDLPPPAYRRSIGVGDVTGDGRDELAWIASGAIRVATMIGPGTWQDLTGNLPTTGFHQVQVSDMNLDGRADILAYGYGTPGHVDIFGSTSPGNWELLARVELPASCDYTCFRAGVDFDHNGYPDFAYIAEENCRPFTGGINTLHALAEASVPAEPGVYIKHPRGGQTFHAGSVRFIDWHAAVPQGAGDPRVTVEWSFAGPDGPYMVLAAGIPNGGRHQWRVPAGALSSPNNFVRLTLHTNPPVTVRSPSPFTIQNPRPRTPGDANCDGAVNFGDINAFVLALADPASWFAAYPTCLLGNADCNNDGRLDFGDINPFVELLGG